MSETKQLPDRADLPECINMGPYNDTMPIDGAFEEAFQESWLRLKSRLI